MVGLNLNLLSSLKGKVNSFCALSLCSLVIFCCALLPKALWAQTSTAPLAPKVFSRLSDRLSRDQCDLQDRTLLLQTEGVLRRLPADLKLGSNVLPLTHNQRVVLIGQVISDSIKQRIEQFVSQELPVTPNVLPIEVINKIQVSVAVSTQQRIRDNFSAVPISTVLENDQWRDFTIRYAVTDATLYLMGVLTPQQSQDLIHAMKHVPYLDKIVTVFEYILPIGTRP